MNISDLKQKIKKNDRLKRTVHYLIMNQRGSCPRLWVKWFVNPFMLTYGKRSKIRRSAIMNVSPINSFILGQESIIEHYVTIDNGVGHVHIGDHSRIGIHNTSPVIIEDESWIGANTVITSGVHIGKHCVIGAGSVVTKDIPDYSVAVGNPAKVVKHYDPCGQQWKRTR